MDMIKNEISYLLDKSLRTYLKKDMLKRYEDKLITKSLIPKPSLANVLNEILGGVIYSVKVWYSQNECFSKYVGLEAWEEDILYEICITANKINLSRDDSWCSVSILNNDELIKVLDVLSNAIKKYFELLLKKNLDILKKEEEFASRILEFGKRHALSEEDLLMFSEDAMRECIDITLVSSVEELDVIYNWLYPSM